MTGLWNAEKIIYCWQPFLHLVPMPINGTGLALRLASPCGRTWLCFWVKFTLKGRHVIWRPWLCTACCWGAVTGWDRWKEEDPTWGNQSVLSTLILACPKLSSVFSSNLNLLCNHGTLKIVNYIHTQFIVKQIQWSYSRNTPSHCLRPSSYCLLSGL